MGLSPFSPTQWAILHLVPFFVVLKIQGSDSDEHSALSKRKQAIQTHQTISEKHKAASEDLRLLQRANAINMLLIKELCELEQDVNNGAGSDVLTNRVCIELTLRNDTFTVVFWRQATFEIGSPPVIGHMKVEDQTAQSLWAARFVEDLFQMSDV